MSPTAGQATITTEASNVVAEWFEKYHRDVRALVLYTMSVGKDEQLADDVVQDTFLRAIISYDQYIPGINKNQDGTDNPKPWLFKLANHALLNVLRARRAQKRRDDLAVRYGHVTDLDPSSGPVAHGFEDTVANRDVLYPALRRLYQLDLNMFYYVVRYYWLEWRQDEIADADYVSRGNIKNVAVRARRTLKMLLESVDS